MSPNKASKALILGPRVFFKDTHIGMRDFPGGGPDEVVVVRFGDLDKDCQKRLRITERLGKRYARLAARIKK